MFQRLAGLAADPRPDGVRKPKGAPTRWRLRIGDWRVVYAVDDRQRLVELERLPEAVASRLFQRLAALAADPRPDGVRKLKGAPTRWRLRIGDWRVVYAVDDRQRIVDILYVRHRSAAYE